MNSQPEGTVNIKVTDWDSVNKDLDEFKLQVLEKEKKLKELQLQLQQARVVQRPRQAEAHLLPQPQIQGVLP